MHIVIADALPAAAAETLQAAGCTVDARAGRSADDLARDLADADALIVRSATQVTPALLGAAPRLRVVARAGTGVDNIDVPAATARGVLVINAAGASSISVAELALGLMIALARGIAAGDAAMKRGVWDKKRLTGVELRDKVLGIVGLGRIGREVASRARAFGMNVIAYDPFLASRAAEAAGVPLVDLDGLLSRAEFISLHVPALPETRHLLNRDRLAKCQRGVRIVNTARGDLIDEAALADALQSGQVAGAGLDVFEVEPPADARLTGLPQVVATPHIAASTSEAQDLVGTDIAQAVRDFLLDGVIRNAVNFPSVPPEDLPRLRPYLSLGERLGSLAAQLTVGRPDMVGIRYYGTEVTGWQEIVGSAVLAGALSHAVDHVTTVNARGLAADRGIEVVESRSTRTREFQNMISVTLRAHADASGASVTNLDRWVEGTVFEPSSPRLCSLEGVPIEMPLSGTLLVVSNEDRPGVIGEIGTALGRHAVNIGSFALGRRDRRALGVISIDQATGLDAALAEIRQLSSVTGVTLVRLP